MSDMSSHLSLHVVETQFRLVLRLAVFPVGNAFSIVAIHYVPSPQDSIDGERLVEKSHFKLRVLVERHLQTRSLILYNHYITTSTTCAFGCF